MSFAAVTRNTLKLARTPAKSFSAPCSCQRVAFASTSASSHAAGDAASASKYELPKGLVLRGIVTSAGKMAQTSTVTVERRVTDHKTLKVGFQQCTLGQQLLIRLLFCLTGILKAHKVPRARSGVNLRRRRCCSHSELQARLQEEAIRADRSDQGSEGACRDGRRGGRR